MKSGNTQNVISMNRGSKTEPRFFPEAVGHEKILASCKKNEYRMLMVFTDGSQVEGVISQFDRWTITLRLDDGRPRTYYKHALKSFGAA